MMPSLPSWLSGHPASAPVPGSTPLYTAPLQRRVKDPNAPDDRLQVAARCIYERQLPGGSYITAHVERLQHGYYDSPVIHEDCISNVRFVAVRFVFHEANTERRFKGAVIRLGLHDESIHPEGLPLPPQLDHPNNTSEPQQQLTIKPKFLRHAPHLLYGAMSPESLDWNFNLAGSLGVAQTPVSASINPSGGIKSSYKVYKMMKIQGSLRTNSSWYGKQYDIEDGELVWTLEENELQKSGLPREFTFVMMLTKGDSGNDIRLNIEIEPEVASWFGSFPQWYVQLLKYQPLYKEPLNLDKDIGQRFEPCDGELGFNFAGLMSTFDNYVSLPGTMYSTHDWSLTGNPSSATNDDQTSATQGKQTKSTAGDANSNNTLHLRIHLDQAQKQANALTATTYPYPSPTAKPQRSPQATPPPKTPPQQASSPPSNSKSSGSGTKATASKPSKPAKRVTIDGGRGTTPPRYRFRGITPLQTHYEEQPVPVSKPKSVSDGEESHQDYEFSFPESMYPPPPKATQPLVNGKSTANHRHTVSASTTSSSAAAGHKITSGPTGTEASPPTAKTALGSHPSLRRTRSRSGLRTASLTSQPEDEEAIAAAMDMLSGSPPPPALGTVPSRSTPPSASIFPSDDMMLATPRTRATLADLMEVERAENARIQRRNGHRDPVTSNGQSRDHSANEPASSYLKNKDPSNNITTRSQDRERNREKRYSLPVTNTGIGYPGTGGRIFNAQDDSLNVRSGKPQEPFLSFGKPPVMSAGNGRSSLMIPIGNKRDTGLGIDVNKPVGGGNLMVRNPDMGRDEDGDSEISSI